MKKKLLIGIIGLLSLTTNLNATPTQITTISKTECCDSSEPKVIKRRERVIIIYNDGTTIVVDKDGSTTVVN